MSEPFVYAFEWDPDKARSNKSKHRVSFETATTVFEDPLHLSVYDEELAGVEERWVTLGQCGDSGLVVVVHTFEETAQGAKLRIISARKATRHERKVYERGDRSR